MEYELIHKVQTGMISPTKLRMKLIGSHNLRKKDGSTKSNSNSSRTSPSKLEDSDFANNSLLSFGDDEVTSPSLEAPSSNKDSSKENNNNNVVVRPQQGFAKTDIVNQSMSVKIMEDDTNLDYDSNASSSSFEFHRGERYSSAAAAHGSNNNNFSRAISSSSSRPVPSKWNDAEKWLVSRQNTAGPKRTALQNQTNRMSSVKVAPDSGNCDKRVDFCKSALQIGLDKFSFAPALTLPNRTNDDTQEPNGVSTIRSVCMRDMGTEMTPATSLEPSMTSTPIGSITPIRSPTSSMPSTPGRGGSPVPTPATGPTAADQSEEKRRELSEEEMKLETRREIVALGVRLGKTNIAAWASKDEEAAMAEKKKKMSRAEMAELERVEFEKRAAVWVEAEKSRHTARYKREEIKIQAWESQQRAKLEAELRRIEAHVEQMRAQAQAKMVKKIALTRQRSEEKRTSAEARKSRDAEITAAQAEFIRQTGRTPSSQYMCCGWL